MLFYYDRIFKDTVEHKIDYTNLTGTNAEPRYNLLDVTNYAPIKLIQIANPNIGDTPHLRKQSMDIFS
jgi:hypothetical protein